MIIGKFTLHGDYTGSIACFGLSIYGVTMRPVPQQKKGTPDFVVIADSGAEIGAAWKKTSKAGKPYLSVKLDGPILPEPIHCALTGQKDGSYDLIWSRRTDEQQPAGEVAA